MSERMRPAGIPVFEHRGVVEGHYGPVWSDSDRIWLVEQIGRWGMNRYVYAPKNDPLQREDWSRPYDAPAMAHFAELVRCGAGAGVDVGFAISPGLSIEYSSRTDRDRLTAKLAAFGELGARFFALALDDVPTRLSHASDGKTFGSLAAAHADLAHAVRDALDPGAILWLVPTDYLGVEPSVYLETLGARLDPGIEVAWTGPTVLSPQLRTAHAAQRARTLGRRLLVWDNVPVNDGPMRGMLHLGPYTGRDPDLAEQVSGVLLNGMELARASGVALRTAADYLCDPAGYAPEAAWHAALSELGAGAGEAFALFAAAHRFSPLWPEDRDPELEAAFRSYAAAPASEQPALLAALRVAAVRRVGAAGSLREHLSDRALATELEPWLASHEAASHAIAFAFELLEQLASDADRLAKCLAFSRFEGRLTRLPRHACVSFGPQRALYPQLVSMREEEAGYGRETALYRDRSLADEIVRFVEDRALALLSTSLSPSLPACEV